MTTFNATRKDYDPDLDVRLPYHRALAERMKSSRPNGPFWLLLAARRMGKSWTLQAIRHLLGETKGAILDLRNEGEILDGEPPCCYLLLDEPGSRLGRPDRATAFIQRCVELWKRDFKILLALSPAEWSQLRHADQGNRRLDDKDLLHFEALTPDQAKQLAKRARWAMTLLTQLGESSPWERKPFLLEHLLEVAEGNPKLRKEHLKLLQVAINRAGGPDRFYVNAVYENGLTEDQRAIVRAVVRDRSASNQACEWLYLSGVLDKQERKYVLTDPVLADHLPPPLRIHHVSDIHVGPKSAVATDMKLKDALGAVLGEATGAGPVRGTYLHHLHALKGSGTHPHLVVVSGDVAEWATADQYQEVAQWFKDLRGSLADHPHLADDDPRILFVGGNHDVDWGQALGTAGARDRHKPFAEAFKDFPHPHLEKAPDKRKADEVVVKYDRLGVVFLLLGSAEFGGEVMTGKDPEQQELVKRINELRKKLKAAMNDPVKGKAIEDLLKRLARIDPGLVHKQDLVRARAYSWTEYLPIRIAVLHHPVSPLPVTEINHFVGLLNAGEVKQALFEMRFCLVLHGHLHMGWFACEQWPEQYGNWTLRIAAAPTLGSRETTEQFGFNEIEVCREGNRYEVMVRRFVRKGNSWVQHGKEMGWFVPGQPEGTGIALAARQSYS